MGFYTIRYDTIFSRTMPCLSSILQNKGIFAIPGGEDEIKKVGRVGRG